MFGCTFWFAELRFRRYAGSTYHNESSDCLEYHPPPPKKNLIKSSHPKILELLLAKFSFPKNLGDENVKVKEILWLSPFKIRRPSSRRGYFHGQNRKQSLLGSLYWDFNETESRAWKISGTEGNEPMEHKSRQVDKIESFVEKANNCHSSMKFMAEMSATVERCTGIAEVTGSNPVQAWIFFRLSFRNCKSCV